MEGVGRQEVTANPPEHTKGRPPGGPSRPSGNPAGAYPPAPKYSIALRRSAARLSAPSTASRPKPHMIEWPVRTPGPSTRPMLCARAQSLVLPGLPGSAPGTVQPPRPSSKDVSDSVSAPEVIARVVHEGAEPERARVGLVDDRHLDLVAGEVGVVQGDAPVLEAGRVAGRGVPAARGLRPAVERRAARGRRLRSCARCTRAGAGGR